MAEKVNALTKSKEYGPQLLEFDLQDQTNIGDNETEGIDDSIKEAVNQGYSIVAIKGSAKTVYYRSNETDGFIREITDENWSRGMPLFVFEQDHVKWCANVDKYFDMLLNDEDSKKYLMGYCKQALLTPAKVTKPFDLIAILEQCRDYLKKQEPKRKWSSGDRKSKVWTFLTRDSKQWSSKGQIPRAVHTYLLKNSPEYKKNLYAKGKKK